MLSIWYFDNLISSDILIFVHRVLFVSNVLKIITWNESLVDDSIDHDWLRIISYNLYATIVTQNYSYILL